MVKLKRPINKNRNEDFISDVQPPENAIMYYGMKPEAKLKEYKFFFTVYDKDRTPTSIMKNKERYDKIFKATSRHSLEKEMQNSHFLTDKDFGAINKYRNNDTHTFIGYILEPGFTADNDKWDYGSVFLDINNNIIVKWRH